MGNCQAAEATTVVIQHPEGKLERLYWPTTAADVMKSNPGHHVALVTTLYVAAAAEEKKENNGGTVRFTRVRLLKPKDMLLTGQVYRLITSQEVNKALRARKQEKTIRAQSELLRKKHRELQQSTSASDQTKQIGKQERNRPKSAAARQWRPSLQSISEGLS